MSVDFEKVFHLPPKMLKSFATIVKYERYFQGLVYITSQFSLHGNIRHWFIFLEVIEKLGEFLCTFSKCAVFQNKNLTKY